MAWLAPVLALVTITLLAASAAGCQPELPVVEKPEPEVEPGPAPEARPGLPLRLVETADFTGSGNCAGCHSGLIDAAGTDVSLDRYWRSSMMANAATDPLWLAKVSSEVARTPALASVIEDKCATCHMPIACTQAFTEGADTGILDGFLMPTHPLNLAALEGVSCTVCHQITDTQLGEMSSFSGNYRIDTDTEPPERLLFGPYEGSEQATMRATVGFTGVYGPQTDDSGLCATCHTPYTPYLDAEGSVAGEFPEQTAYLEWEHSDFGDGAGEDVACQACHMPEAAGEVVIATLPGEMPGRAPFFQHTFVGGNAVMLRLLRDNVEELGLTASTDQFEDTLARTVEQLQSAAGVHLDRVGIRRQRGASFHRRREEPGRTQAAHGIPVAPGLASRRRDRR